MYVCINLLKKVEIKFGLFICFYFDYCGGGGAAICCYCYFLLKKKIIWNYFDFFENKFKKN